MICWPYNDYFDEYPHIIDYDENFVTLTFKVKGQGHDENALRY